MSIETYTLYLVTLAIFFAHPPGPSQVLFMAGAAQHGLGRATSIMAGDLSANALQILVAGFGLAGLITASATAFQVVKWAGVAYLIWMGLSMIRSARRPARPAPPPRAALFRRGFITSAANPYAVIFFAALFPQFIDPALPAAPQVAILGLTYLVVDGAILLAMGATAMKLFQLLGSRVERWIGAVSGAGLIAAAIALALRGAPQRS